ncbi:anthranilate phosphoribosyltransferase [Candidatus Termititenax persephonae]|uniref:Anthranilate phosphoribosyltransferase n=1 Tax=Candidatus Termititenax persephonae TaxID=2218525 RepID=A0A388TGN0_9BACT|nr:anthranilate phosphoribosyltransferase [Candidatus Termititenax persephonae]
MRNLSNVIQKLIDKNTFPQRDAAEVMEQILSGKCSDAELGAFLIAMRLKGEDSTELLGFVQVIRRQAVKGRAAAPNLIDTCGTGGCLQDTFNISTLAAFVAAAAGAKVAKQVYTDPGCGCSSRQVLASWGIDIGTAPPDRMLKLLAKTGLTFLYLPVFHPRLEQLVRVGQQIGILNLLNTLFPLINPLKPRGRVLGVFNEQMTTLLAGVLRTQGVRRAFVVHGVEGLDEISVSADTRISELRGGQIETYMFNPEKFGLAEKSVSGLQCSSAADSAQIGRIILSGREESERTDTVALNAGAALVAAGLVKDLAAGFQKAREVLRSGKAWKKLEQTAEIAQSLAKKQKKPLRLLKNKRKTRK